MPSGHVGENGEIMWSCTDEPCRRRRRVSQLGLAYLKDHPAQSQWV